MVQVKADWPLQDAKAHLSQLVNCALEEGPQRITRHGKAAAVVLSEADFKKLVGRKRGSLGEFLAHSPLRGLDIDVRDHGDSGREVDL